MDLPLDQCVRGFATLVCLPLSCVSLRAAAIPADSRITSVTIYEPGTVVTQEAVVQLEAGLQVVRFADLPEDLDENLLQVSAFKPGEKRELPLKLTVEHPTDFEIQGLQ